MRRIIQNPSWWLPVTAGLLAVLFFTTIVLRMGPRPAVAPGVQQPVAPAVPVAIDAVSLEGVVREYRGWLEVPAGTVTVRVRATAADSVKVVHWLASEQAPVVDATVLREQPIAERQPDGSWVATWEMKASQTAHAIAYAQDPAEGIAQSDTLNIRAVR